MNNQTKQRLSNLKFIMTMIINMKLILTNSFDMHLILKTINFQQAIKLSMLTQAL